MEALIWLALMVGLIAVEILTLGLTTIWFAGGAAVACVAALCHAPLVLQIVLFLIVSVLLLVLTRPLAIRYMDAGRQKTKTNVNNLIGKEAVVTKTICNLRAEGQILLDGMEWTARSVRENEIIEKETVVLVERIDGVKAMVTPKDGADGESKGEKE